LSFDGSDTQVHHVGEPVKCENVILAGRLLYKARVAPLFKRGYMICLSMRELRDTIEATGQYMHAHCHDKASQLECQEALKAMAKYRQSLEPVAENNTNSASAGKGG
jgi:hypothetical protein